VPLLVFRFWTLIPGTEIWQISHCETAMTQRSARNPRSSLLRCRKSLQINSFRNPGLWRNLGDQHAPSYWSPGVVPFVGRTA